MPEWLSDIFARSSSFMPHGHCYLWIPSLLWLHVLSDALIGIAYLGISLLLYVFVRRIRLPFSPVFIAFGLFIALCGLTHFMKVWTVWNPDYLLEGFVKAATAAASVATAIGLFYVRPQVEAVVHTARLSEQRRVQLETAHAELQVLYGKVTELDRLKTEFFANVSHELRTPLALILGPAERMLADANLTADQRRQLETIGRNSKTLLRQVNDLLDVAKLEAGKMTIRYVEVDLAPWFRRIASQFEGVAEQRRIRYAISAPESLRAEIDPHMLERTLTNVLSNAFKFTPEHGTIRAVLEARADRCSFYVEDSGPGIAHEHQQAIFERFRQADGSATRRHGGTGLGLAIVKEFVSLHGGRVHVTSSPGHGAKFTVEVPLRAPANAEVGRSWERRDGAAELALEATLRELSGSAGDEATLTASSQPDVERASVLVVEDNREMRDFVASTLSGEYQVIAAQDGQEGLEKALALQPDAVVTDLMMPRMSGEQLVAALKARSELSSVPILMLTAKADDALRVNLLRRGAQDYLTKPFLPEELRARVANLVAMKRTCDTLRGALTSASADVEALARELVVKHRELEIALEAAAAARQQAEQVSEIKSHFLGMVSHELRTPLSTMHVNTQVLARHAGLPAPFKAALNRLARAIRQMSTLVEGLLEYTRMEGGKVQLQLEPIDAPALLNEVVEAHAMSRSPDVHLQLAAFAPPSVALVSDPRLLRVALDNLVSNALKFTRQGTVTLRWSGTGDRHVFEVHDTGVGIPQADIHRIFLPFEQLEPVKRKSIPGVGLGLALVKQIVEVLRGTVEVLSAPGEGSTFRILLPAGEAVAQGGGQAFGRIAGEVEDGS